MARINLEDSIFKEDRYIKLCIAAGGRIPGIGSLACLWIEAQKHYLTHREIPAAEWLKADLPEYLIATGWAERTATGVKAKGQDDQFAWLRQAQAAGEASAEARKKAGSAKPKRRTPVQTNTEPPLTDVDSFSTSSLLPPSSSSSLSSQDNLNFSEDSCNGTEAPPPPKRPRKARAAVQTEKTIGSKIFEAYALAYEARYQEPPIRDRVANALCKAIGESLGEEGIAVAKFYLTHNKAFYVQAYHPLNLFKQDAAALRTQWATGTMMTGGQARNIENKQNVFNAFGKLLKPEGGSNGNGK